MIDHKEVRYYSGTEKKHGLYRLKDDDVRRLDNSH
jgi:hypothetical protein